MNIKSEPSGRLLISIPVLAAVLYEIVYSHSLVHTNSSEGLTDRSVIALS
jgi:hypothetical protein